MERVLNSGGRPSKPDKLTLYDDYDLWEDRMKVYLEAVDEGARPAAILGRLDNEVNTVARAANLTASLTPATIFERLQREFGWSSMPGVLCRPQKSPTTRGRVCHGFPTTSSCAGPASLLKRALHRA
ncbi:unnamed protein product [Schistocephalus solidus]|uniref:Retrovirus-related Pol polyprotein from transposon TNT 1-94 n=1 Tax=Schistocephalus solidus TaxID=70667 RepID=A0A183T962_SCHSO|nr:unnamed protein product [Schistocephalus solidus]